MQVQGINNTQGKQAPSSPIQGNDSRIQAYQQQIVQLQQKIQDLSQNEDLTMEEKMKKRQEINQQIHMVEQQMRQVQREIRQEQNKAKKNAMDEMISTPKKSGADLMSSDKMRSLIAGGQAMKQADGNMALSKEMDGKARVLAGEIAADQQRGINTEQKEEEMADLEQRADLLKSDAVKAASEASDGIRKADEEEQAEENGTDKKEKDIRDENADHSDGLRDLSEGVQVHVDIKL